MDSAHFLASPLLFPFRVIWNLLAFAGRIIVRIVTFSLKLTLLVILVLLLLLWFGR
jgi:hypothetical protein